MKKPDFTIILVIVCVLGASILLFLSVNSMFARKEENAQTNPSSPTTSPRQVVGDVPVATATPVVKVTPFSTTTTVASATNTSFIEGDGISKDIDDVLLLYNSAKPNSLDINFCKVAVYYGLLCKMVALDTVDLTDALLRDPNGEYYKLVGISASTLLQKPSLLLEAEIITLKSAIIDGGLNLLVSNLDNQLNIALLSNLTDGAVRGVDRVKDTHRDWVISAYAPGITRELSGQTIVSTSKVPQGDFALLFDQLTSITTLVSSNDNAGLPYPIFIRWESGKGSIFIDSGERGKSLSEYPLMDIYYDIDHFSGIMPLMFTMRYTLGNETWHQNINYANLTIDDPILVEPYDFLSYTALFKEMQIHNFHTTISLIPGRWQKYSPEVIDLFIAHPDRYSLVQHGNNHDGYEFYKYSLTGKDPKDNPDFSARPLVEQEADILEGLSRLKKMKGNLGLPFDQVMIFPNGISPEETLVLLKKNNYLATINAQDVPLDATRPTTWDYGMYPAEMYYGNFATLTRRHPGTYQPFKPDIQPFLLDMFIDKPALFYSHAYEGELFADGINTFDLVADRLNKLAGGVEWENLGTILTHLYSQKTNDDGSVDIRMYTNQLFLKNDTQQKRIYHIVKQETLNVPIISLTIFGQNYPFRVENGLLLVDMRVPANFSGEINIRYGN